MSTLSDILFEHGEYLLSAAANLGGLSTKLHPQEKYVEALYAFSRILEPVSEDRAFELEALSAAADFIAERRARWAHLPEQAREPAMRAEMTPAELRILDAIERPPGMRLAGELTGVPPTGQPNG